MTRLIQAMKMCDMRERLAIGDSIFPPDVSTLIVKHHHVNHLTGVVFV